MGLNVAESHAVNVLIDILTAPPGQTIRAQAIESFATLADGANKRLGAGHNGTRARALLELRLPGQISPREPVELGAWLRALPDDTILASESGNAWQLNYGVESGADEDREFRAMLSALGAEVFEITEGHVDLASLAELAPFSVLALGEGEPEDGAACGG